MLSVSEISENQIEMFSRIYSHLSDSFSGDLVTASDRKKRRVCKWISKNCSWAFKNLSPEFPARLRNPQDASDLIAFLAECQKRQYLIKQEREHRLEALMAQFDEDVRMTMKQALAFCDPDGWLSVKQAGNDVIIVVEPSPAYYWMLVLENADGCSEKTCLIALKDAEILPEIQEKRYRLHCSVAGEADGCTFSFSNARVKIEYYKATGNWFSYHTPGYLICTVAHRICEKSKLPGVHYSPAETELLPLMRELSALYASGQPVLFTNLKQLAEAHGYHKLVSLLARTEKKIAKNRKDSYLAKFPVISALCQQKYEPLWREIYEQIVLSQSVYPDHPDFSILKHSAMEPARERIQRYMEEHGYSGTYPDFYKMGSLHRFQTVYSYHMPHVIGRESRVLYQIHCNEFFDEGICFLSGTALLKPGEDEADTDIVSCMFNAQGRRLFHSIDFRLATYADGSTNLAELDGCLDAVLKSTECQRLSRKERKQYLGLSQPVCKSNVSGFATWFLLIGGSFSIVLHLLMCLAFVFCNVNHVFQTLLQYPWGWSVLGGWIALGCLTWLLEVVFSIVRKKR